MKEQYSKTDKYRLTEEKKTFRSATIIFQDGVFVQCDYCGVASPHSFDSWLFLGKVSQRIQELQQEYNKGKK